MLPRKNCRAYHRLILFVSQAVSKSVAPPDEESQKESQKKGVLLSVPDAIMESLHRFSPLRKPELMILLPLQMYAVFCSALAFPYHLITRKNFGERYVTPLTGILTLTFVVSTTWVQLGIGGIFLTLGTGFQTGAIFTSLIWGIVICVAFVRQVMQIRKRRKEGSLPIHSRYDGTPIIWDLYFRHRYTEHQYKLWVEPIVLLVMCLCIFLVIVLTEGFFLVPIMMFFLGAMLTSPIPELASRKITRNQLLDRMDMEIEAIYQQEEYFGEKEHRQARPQGTENNDYITDPRNRVQSELSKGYREQFECLQKIKNGWNKEKEPPNE